MNDAFLVRGGQAAGDRDGDLHGSAMGNRAALELRPEGLSLEQLGDRIRGALVAPEIVDGEDVRVVERRDRVRLPLETRERVGVLRQRFGEHLDRNVALQLRIPRLVDLAHAPGTERREDFVGAETGAGGESHGFRTIL